MIHLEVHDNDRQHFTISGDEPFRVEVSSTDDRVLAEVYRGSENDPNDEPIGCFDGMNDNNTDWAC